LSACVSSTPAPVHNDGRSLREPAKAYRIVVPGDTLFSIAWESGKDYHQLAEWNNINDAYVIKPGQRIRLTAPTGSNAREQITHKQSVTRYRVRQGDTIYSIARRLGLSPKALAAANGLKNYRIYPGQVLHVSSAGGSHRVKQAKAGRIRSKNLNKTAKISRKSKKPIRPYKGGWRWPTDGRLVGRYTGKGKKKGIEIAGKRGQAIIAAAKGKVVYQGSGLRGYGRLLILKHNDDYLSAYAHCENIYAKEGDVIKQGTRIATMGDSGTDRVKLHFEIRYRGNPVNPLKHLPRQ
jgi:lipoprotein NlpD